METIFIYLLKSSGLIAMFYLAYHFLLRKETFFDSNRWFLLSGLITSLLLPLYFIKKVVYVERPKVTVNDFVSYAEKSTTSFSEIPVAETFDWIQFIGFSYIIIVCAFGLKIIFNLVSLFLIIKNNQITKKEHFKLLNLNKNITPFSFFNYIAYNADLYSKEELQSILQHEKIHSQEKHSIDVLLIRLFCAVFWFNPFIWLYKKAILQNLEYIADNKATKHLEDKKDYQITLLKVVANQNCLSIANNFNQSLIKNRIVMLNKNHSNRKNSWKYAVVLPSLICFIFLFQVKVVAQDQFIELKDGTTTVSESKEVTEIDQKETGEIGLFQKSDLKSKEVSYVFDKISTDAELKNDAQTLKREHNIDLTFSKVKRNSKGEIIAIKISYDDNKGNKGTTEQIRDIPIRAIFFRAIISENGKNELGFYDNSEMRAEFKDKNTSDKIAFIENISDDALIYVDGERYTKEFLNELDPKGLEKIEVLKDLNSLKKYDAVGKKGVIVITTNWSTKPAVPKSDSPVIFTLENGNEIVVHNRANVKIPGYPIINFTENEPVFIIDGVQQKNSRLSLESIDVSKIKTIKLLNKNNEDPKNNDTYKFIVTTK